MSEHDPRYEDSPPPLEYRRRGDAEPFDRRRFWSGFRLGCLITVAVIVLAVGVVFASCVLSMR
jgi:hypothetical protein